MTFQHLAGVYAASVTPLNDDLSFDPEGLVALLNFYAKRGCHGTLLLGTTGEGPSFSAREREVIFRTAIEIRGIHPDFRLLAGTGTPALEETVSLTRLAFELGFDGVVVLPPYYYRNADDKGLLAWYQALLIDAVPENGALFGYHIPSVSGVSLSLDLLSECKERFPDKFAGIKDSSGSIEHAAALEDRFGKDLIVLNGNDRLFSKALKIGADGCITAMASLVSDDLRKVWDTHQKGKTKPGSQASLNTARDIWEKYPPAAALIKLLLANFHGFPLWAVKPPLQKLPDEIIPRALTAWKTRGEIA